MIEVDLPRARLDRLRRAAIVRFINSGWLFAAMVRLGQACAGLLPAALRHSVPVRQPALQRNAGQHARKVLMLAGCVQPALAPNTNTRAINLLDRLGIEVVELPQNLCCGAAAMHTSEPAYALRQVKQLIDCWWPHIDAGAEAIVVTATGCGVSVRDYARLLADDPDYAAKAQQVSALYRDLIEVVEAHVGRIDVPAAARRRVAVHTPCSMQHGLGLNNRVERLLAALGYQVCRVEEAHLCCGSAGTYSMLQPALAGQLQQNKLRALTVDKPDVIATANIGCQLHLAQDASTPVVHWIELI
jgi:glycolate oxidase iron-sulfur subunit